MDGSETITCINCNEVMETIVLPAIGGIWRFILPITLVVIIVAVIIGIVYISKKKK